MKPDLGIMGARSSHWLTLITSQTRLFRCFFVETVFSKIMAPKDIDALVYKTYEYVALHVKRDSSDVVKIMGVMMGCVSLVIWVGPI